MPRLCQAITVCLCLSLGLARGQTSRGGGAGHALIFSDHAVVLNDFKGLDTDAFTFEAWIATSDYCHRSAIMSYSSSAASSDPKIQGQKINDFVVFDPLNVFACHDFQYLDIYPDHRRESCFATYNFSRTANFVGSDLTWHHIAVTWTAADGGMIKIYKDGLLMTTARTGKTEQIASGGSFMLGAEQDCVGGCTDAQQAFYGLMDEVRVWRVARTQEEIMTNMRIADRSSINLDDASLVAYWQFNDPDEVAGVSQAHLVAKDLSTYHNDLPLIDPPTKVSATIRQGGKAKQTQALQFSDSYALNEQAKNMPTRDLTVAFWAKTNAFNASAPAPRYSTFLTYATHLPDAVSQTGRVDGVFVDDAIRIWKYYDQYGNKSSLDYQNIDTVGAMSVHINANRDGNGQLNENWLDYAVRWVDDQWHHVAVTWVQETGNTELFFDGIPQTPFWTSSAGHATIVNPSQGGTSRSLARGTSRLDTGSLVLAQNQECFAGCFSPSYSLDGAMADLRFWSSALSQAEVQADMWSSEAGGNSLSSEWNFANVQLGALGKDEVREATNKDAGSFLLWADAPKWEYSTAPLTYNDGMPVDGPTAGVGGHAIALNDRQALMLSNFKEWPSAAITVEFWMWSVDTCRWGSPISYAAGSYESADNTFLIFNYNDWGVSVMEDEGKYLDHTSGLAATDGVWHHIAVSWQSSDGRVSLYDNGRKVWSVVRAAGKFMPAGGTLVIGREQDCPGGCFDSHAGAVGNIDYYSQEYGSQDFFGLIDEMRIWRTVRTEEQIKQGMTSALRRNGAPAHGLAPIDPISLDDPDLVAYWTFDEGQGYRVKDVTNKGHDLTLTQHPRWQVVRWMAVCGDGNIEGPEECDDGNVADGDGCSAGCLVEDGWECSSTSPSLCTNTGSGPILRPPPPERMLPPPPPSAFHPSSDKSKSGGSSHGWIAALVISVVAVGLVAGLAFFYRERLAAIDFKVPAAIRRRLSGRANASGLDYLDPEEDLDLAPEFVGATRPPQGRYQNLPGAD